MTDAADKAEARHANRIAAAFREGMAKARARVDRKALVDAIARGDVYGARRIISDALAREGFRAVEAAWGHAAAEQGKVAADEAPDLPVRKVAVAAGFEPATGGGACPLLLLPQAQGGLIHSPTRRRDEHTPDLPVRKRVTFNFLSGRVAASLGGWAVQLGRSLYNLAMQAVDAVLGPGIAERAPPQQLADDLVAVMGLSPRDAGAVFNYRKSLQGLDRAALRSQLRDARNDPRILSAIREQRPLPPEYVDKLVARYADRLEASRARMIGRTEALRARWTGVQALWDQQVSEGLVSADAVTKRWHHRGDHRVRDTHRSIPVIQPEGVALNAPFRTSAGNALAFPGDPSAPMSETANCRCFLSYRVRNEARAA